MENEKKNVIHEVQGSYQKVVRINKSAYDKLVDFANEQDLKISQAASMFIEYCLDNVEFKNVQVEVKRLVIGETILR